MDRKGDILDYRFKGLKAVKGPEFLEAGKERKIVEEIAL